MQAGTYYSTRSEDALNRINTFEASWDAENYHNASLEALRMLIGEAETRRLTWRAPIWALGGSLDDPKWDPGG